MTRGRVRADTLVLLGILALVLASLARLMWVDAVEAGAARSRSSYSSIVNDIYIRNGWLRADRVEYDDGTSGFEVGLALQDGRGGAIEPDLAEALHKYAFQSRLNGDIEHHNRNTASPFQIRHGQLANNAANFHRSRTPYRNTASPFQIRHGQLANIAANFHRSRTPFEFRARWTGALTFGDLAKGGVVLRRLPDGRRGAAEWPLAPLPGRNPTDAAIVDVLAPSARASGGGDAYEFRFGGGNVVARSFLLGRTPVLQMLASNDVHAWFRGHLVRPGQYVNLSGPGLLRLERSDGSQGVAIEAGRQRADNWVYASQPFGPALWNEEAPTPFTLGVVEAIRAEVAGGTRSVLRDVPLTINPALDRAVQRELEALCERIRLRTATREVFRAAVTVMNGLTGEVLSMASYPTERQSEALDGETREPMLANHNLSRLEVGSVAKIPLAAAIVSNNPDLLELRVRGDRGRDTSRLFGHEFPKPLEDHAPGVPWVDFDIFIEKSDNFYAATLMALGAVDRERYRRDERPVALEPKEWFSIRGQIQKEVPRGFVFGAPESGRTANPSAHTLGWAKHLGRLFQVYVDDPLRHAPQDLQPDHGTYVWRHLGARLFGADSLSVYQERAVVGVSPEIENLRLNEARNFRGEYLSLVLGGGESRWTNVRLAEVFSRLATGRQVRATLVQGQDRFPELEMDGDIRARFVRAMSLVAAKGGTAAALSRERRGGSVLRQLQGRAEASGVDFVLLSKTGTPYIEYFKQSADSRLVEKLASDRVLTIRQPGAPAMLDGVEVRDWRRTYQSVLDGAGDPHGLYAKYFREEGGSARLRSILQKLTQYNAARPDVRLDKLDVKGSVIRLRESSRADKARGKNYVFVAGLYPKGSRAAPSRALAVSITIQQTIEKSPDPELNNAAVALAARLLDREVGNALFELP